MRTARTVLSAFLALALVVVPIAQSANASAMVYDLSVSGASGMDMPGGCDADTVSGEMSAGTCAACCFQMSGLPAVASSHAAIVAESITEAVEMFLEGHTPLPDPGPPRLSRPN